MRVFQNTAQVPPDCHGAVVAIGNFDGVHLGHQAVIARAASAGAPVGILTFEPHPRAVLAANPQTAFRLTPSPIKRRHLEAIGVAFVIEQPFDAALAAMPAERFVTELLVGHLKPAGIVVGYDFCFGRDRGGDAALLTKFGKLHGFDVHIVDPVQDPGAETFSSNRIRKYLQDGEPARAAALLGHLWEIEGEVIHGEAIGRTIGYPTANVALTDYLLPKFGVYAIRAGADRGGQTQWRDGVANIGNRPTVGGKTNLLEFYLFDFDGDLYGAHWRVALAEFIRPEVKFDGLETMKKQIALDVREARELLSARRIRAGTISGPQAQIDRA